MGKSAMMDPNCTLWHCWHASPELCSDRDFIRAMVQVKGSSLKHASGDLKMDRDVVLCAVQQDGQALAFASADLQADRDLARVAVEQDPCNLEHVSADLQADRPFVHSALRNGTYPRPFGASALKHVSQDLRADEETVLLAIRQRPGELRYASRKLQETLGGTPLSTDGIRRVAPPLEYNVSQTTGLDCIPSQTTELDCIPEETLCALKYAPSGFESDHGFMLNLLEKAPMLLSMLGSEVQEQRAFVLKAVQHCGSVLKFASDDLRMDAEVVLAALNNDEAAYEFVPEQLRLHHDVALLMAQKYRAPLPKRLLKDRKVVLAAAARRLKLGVTGRKSLRKTSLQTLIAKFELA